MKFLKHIFTLFTVFSFAFTFAFTLTYGQGRNVTVASDKSLTAEFSSFETFDFARQIGEDQVRIFFLDDALLKENIKDAVTYELEARGYEHTNSNPDLLVNFRVLEEETEFTGYTGVYRDENYWTSTEMRKDMIGLVPEAEVRSAENQRTYLLDEGTLMVHLVDTNSGELIWQGYASGVMDGEIIDGEEDKVKEAVSLIFQTYDWRADDYDVSN